MQTEIVLTLTGPDRVGVVEEVTGCLLSLGGNVESSRMARLGGEFAILMLASLPEENLGRIGRAVCGMEEQGYRVTVQTTSEPASTEHEGWLPYRVQVLGADHEGIVHEIAQGLSRDGITIESMETSTSSAPTTGTSLFSMSAKILVPPGVDEKAWIADVMDAGAQANVDVTVESDAE